MHGNELEILKNHLIAQGPEGLRQVLDTLLEKSLQDSGFAAEPHFVKYQLGQQESFLKVDMSEKPYLFWYCDLQGRPVTKAIQTVIADFLWEKCGEKEKCLQELEA